MTTEVLRLGMNTTSYEAGAKRVQASTAGMTTGLTGAQKAAAGFGLVLGGAFLLGALSGAVKGFIEFDQAMTQSLAIMQDVTAALQDDMVQAARDVAVELNYSSSQAAESFFFLASAGLDAEQSIAALPATAKFARAGMFDLSTATDLATDAQSALGLASKDAQVNLVNMTRVTDVLVKANTLANASVEQFSTALTTEAGAALKTFGKSIEEGVAVLAAFADQGVKSQVAGTGLSRILRLMGSAAVNNAEAYEKYNIAVFDATGEMRNMADIIADLEVATSTMSDATRIAALEQLGFQARVQGVILPLIGTSEKIREYEKALKSAGGTTEEVAENQMLSLQNRIGQIKQEFAIWKDEIVEGIVPVIELFIEHAGKLALALQTLAVVFAAKWISAGVMALSVWIQKMAASTVSAVASTKAMHGLAIAKTRAAVEAFTLAAAEKKLAISLERVSNAELRATLFAKGMAAAHVEAAAAGRLVQGSMLGVTTATVGAGAAMTRLGVIARAVWGLMGGWIGVVLIGLWAVYKAIKAIIKGKQEEKAAIEEAQKASEAEFAAKKAGLQELTRSQLEATRANLEMVEAQQAAIYKTQGHEDPQAWAAAGEKLQQLGELRREVDRLIAEYVTGVRTDTPETVLSEEAQASRDLVAALKIQVEEQERLRAATVEGGGAIEQVNRELERERALHEALQTAVVGDRKEVEGLVNELYDLKDATADVVKEQEALRLATDRQRELSQMKELYAAQGSGATSLALLNLEHERANELAALGIDLTAEERAEAEAHIEAVNQQKRALVELNAEKEKQDRVDDMMDQLDQIQRMTQAQLDGKDAVNELTIAMAGQAAVAQLGAGHTETYKNQIRELAEEIARAQIEGAEAIADAGKLTEPWEEALREIQRMISSAFDEVFRGEIENFKDFADQVLDIFVGLASEIASAMLAEKLGLPELLKKMQNDPEFDIGSTGAGKAIKYGGGAVVGGMAGYQSGSPVMGAISGAATGAALGGVPGAIIGGVVGLVGGLFGAAKKAKEAARAMEEARKEWAKSLDEWIEGIRVSMGGPLQQTFEQIRNDLNTQLEAFAKLYVGKSDRDAFQLDADADPSEWLIWLNNALTGTGARLREGSEAMERWSTILEGATLLIEQAIEAEQKRLASISRNLNIEQLQLEGKDKEARALQYEAELLKAQEDAWTGAQIAQLAHIQGLREEKIAQEEAAATAQKLADFTTQMMQARSVGDPGNQALARAIGMVDINKTVEGFESLVEAGEITQDTLDAFRDTLVGNLDKAIWQEIQALERLARSFDAETLAREYDLAGQSMEAFTTILQERGQQEIDSARDLYEAGKITEAAYNRRVDVVNAETQAALAQEEASRAATAAAFTANTAMMKLAQAGDEVAIATAKLTDTYKEDLDAARELLTAGIITEEMFQDFAATLKIDLAGAIREVEEAARDAAQAERFRAMVDMENLQMRLLVAQGRDKEATSLRNQLEIMKAIQEGRSGQYIALLQQIHATEAAAKATQEQNEALRETKEAADSVSSALNAPQGLRLSLLRHRATMISDMTPDFGVSQASPLFGSPQSQVNPIAQPSGDGGGGTSTQPLVIQVSVDGQGKTESDREVAKRLANLIQQELRAGAPHLFNSLTG